jgi:glyceraldehyde-3-phosphate dehydrogenase (NADP+)
LRRPLGPLIGGEWVGLDVTPVGGTKQSGIGREGVRFAIQEMMETRVVCLNL